MVQWSAILAQLPGYSGLNNTHQVSRKSLQSVKLGRKERLTVVFGELIIA